MDGRAVRLVTTAIRRTKAGRGRFRAASDGPSRPSFSRNCHSANSNAPIPCGTMSAMTNW